MEHQLSSSGIFSQDVPHCRFFRRSKNDLQDRKIEPEEFEDRIIFMTMFNNIEWTKNWNEENGVFQIQKKSRCTWRDSRKDIGPSSDRETRGSGMEVNIINMRNMDSVASHTVQRFKETGHPVFKSLSALSRGILNRKNGRETIHFHTDTSNTELFIPIHSRSKSAQYPRSSLKLVWRVRSSTMWERRYFRQVCNQRKWRDTEDGESTRSELFGTNSKEWVACIRKRFARKSSEHWITAQDLSIYENLRKRIVQAQGIGWYELQDHSWREWWFWRFHNSMPRVHTSSIRTKMQTACGNSRKNHNWTCHRSSPRTTAWQP